MYDTCVLRVQWLPLLFIPPRVNPVAISSATTRSAQRVINCAQLTHAFDRSQGSLMPGLLAVKPSAPLGLDAATGGSSCLRSRIRRNSEVTFLVYFASLRLLSCRITLRLRCHFVYMPGILTPECKCIPISTRFNAASPVHPLIYKD